MKKEIEIWLETKQLEFTQKDNKGSRYTPLQYLHKYVFTDLHEAYFFLSRVIIGMAIEVEGYPSD
jgi:hypothetical protein